jgi:protein-tyrosine phosphatase
MIDLHCHIHVGVDDGPETPEEAIKLAQGLLAVGVTKVATTSHVRPDKGWMNTLEKEAERKARLDAVLDGAGVKLERVQGAEHYVDERVFGVPLEGRVVPYGSSKYILVELPYQGEPPNLMNILFGIRRQGYRVLLAHVERFPYVADHPAKLDAIAQAGHLVQVNLGSLAGAYTKPMQKAAERLLGDGSVSVLCGDCHRFEDIEPFIEKGRKAAKKLIDDATLTKLTVTNPQKILDDLPAEKIWP